MGRGVVVRKGVMTDDLSNDEASLTMLSISPARALLSLYGRRG